MSQNCLTLWIDELSNAQYLHMLTVYGDDQCYLTLFGRIIGHDNIAYVHAMRLEA